MTLLQIISETEKAGVSANWLFGSVISLLLIVIGWVLSMNLRKMDAMLQKHDDQIQKNSTDIEVLKYTHGDALKLSNEILDKIKLIKAMQ